MSKPTNTPTHRIELAAGLIVYVPTKLTEVGTFTAPADGFYGYIDGAWTRIEGASA